MSVAAEVVSMEWCRLRGSGSKPRMSHGAITSKHGSCLHQRPRCRVASAMRKRLTGSRQRVLGVEDLGFSGVTREPLPACRLRSPRARDRTSCQLGKLDVRETMFGACDVVLRVEPRAEQQGVVRSQRDAGAGLDQLTHRYVSNHSVHAKRDVAAGAHLERDAATHYFVKHLRVLNAADAVSQSIGGKGDQSLLNRRRSQQLSAVRNAGESGATRDIEGRRELGCDSTAFIVAQPESDHMSRAATGVARGKPRKDSRIQRVPDPARSNDDGHTDAGIFGGAPRLVQDDLQSWGDAADKRCIRGWVDLDLEPL